MFRSAKSILPVASLALKRTTTASKYCCRAIHSSSILFNEAAAAAAPVPEASSSPAPTSSGKPVDEATLNRLVDEFLNLDFVEMNQILKIFQTKLNVPDEEYNILNGISAASSADAATAATAAKEEVKEKDAFGLKMGAVDAKAKIKVIKEVRTITGLGLKEAKELVEKAPVVLKEGLKKEEAEAFKKLLTEAGATVELV